MMSNLIAANAIITNYYVVWGTFSKFVYLETATIMYVMVNKYKT